MQQIKLSNGSVALVDDEDFMRLSSMAWHESNFGYAHHSTWDKSIKKRSVVVMHRLITNAPKGFDVDHINGNKLDNRKANLRVCNRTQNNQSRRYDPTKKQSRFKGVARTANGKWKAQINIDKRYKYLGTFTLEIDAAKAYDSAAIRHFGSFARTNF